MNKIGGSVLKKTSYRRDRVLGVNSLPVYVEEVVKVLHDAERPLNASEVNRRTRIRAWITTKRILDSLVEKGIVEVVFRSGKITFYRIKKEKL